MAMNHDYYTLVHNYVLKKGMDRVDANGIATSLAVLIPLRHNFGEEEYHSWPDNQAVVESINKLNGSVPYTRIVPLDLALPVIKVATYDDLPPVTTYGQVYHIANVDEWMETKPNGITQPIQKRILISITEPLFVDIHSLSALKEKAAKQGLQIEVTCKSADHPDNIIGLAKMRQMFAAEPEQMLKAEAEAQRSEDQAGWSRTSDRIKFRGRPSTRLTRMRARQRRG